ncbi:UNVERIFIED_CONTAM: Beta-carotene isomerase D27, chloroplastic [Sesamum angustifolium]|uniref:Beta-carotene isomerase D27, chloroplastic n=1 Tax=Sesamum angustifolium TaxID=2727405 RepID=A0AAW2QV20_9LAMI
MASDFTLRLRNALIVTKPQLTLAILNPGCSPRGPVSISRFLYMKVEGLARLSAMALLNHLPLLSIPSLHSPKVKPSARVSCFSARSNSVEAVELKSSRKEYVPGVVDDIFMNVFRSKMVEEIGWDSEKPGYDGLIDAAHRLMVGRSNSEATKASVFVEKCKYLEESKCVGVCINTCKLPTQFKFGVSPPQPEDDSALKEPCLHICPTANRRKEVNAAMYESRCPKA